MADPPARRGWFGGLGVALATVGLAVWVGPLGVAAGLGAALAWYLLPPTYAFAVGQLLAVASMGGDVLAAGGGTPLAVSEGVPLAAAAAVEFGLLAVLVGPLAVGASPGRAVGAFVAAFAAVGAVAWALRWTGRPLWLAALAAALVAATAAYGIHRYERVALGLVTDEGEGRRDGGRERSSDGREGTT